MTPDIGKTAEYVLAAELLRRGLVPFWPSTQMGAVDLVVCNETRASRIQVKASVKDGLSIQVSAKLKDHGKERAYTSKDVDFLAIYLASYKLWYLIPVRAAKGQTLYLRPEDPRCRYAKFKEAWVLLDQ